MNIAQHTKGLLQSSLITLTFMGLGTTAGMVMSFKSDWTWQWPLFILVWELAFLYWSGRHFTSAHPAAARCLCVLKIQIHAAVQILLALAVMMLAATALGSSTDGLKGTGWSQYMTIKTLFDLAGGILKLSVVTSIAIAWGRLHLLLMAGVRFDTLISGEFYLRTVQAPADATSVEKALVRLLERLEMPNAQRFSRYLVSAEVTVKKRLNAPDATYELTWHYLPCMAIITLVPTSPASTEVAIRFRLRGGYFLTELMLNVVDVHMTGNFLSTNVIRPLISESNLSQALGKQNELRDQALESQLRILQAQIEPHFLFNTLANVRHLYRSSVGEGEQMMDHLITYLRGTLEELRSDASTVGKEMDLVVHYLAIMKIRMGERLSYKFNLPASLIDRPFPPAMLISLVENAIKHGLHDRRDGMVTLEAGAADGMLHVSVHDNGVGLSSVGGTGVGLTNIRQRLEAMYGAAARLEVGTVHDGGFFAQIAIPFDARGAV
ncbi:MAG: histidine kinase [Pseudomonadota bacterium]|nr:histidine kinase [Pseudomonadota bacterium]